MRKYLLLAAAPLLLAACQGDVTGDLTNDGQPAVQDTAPSAPADTLQDPGITVSEPSPDAEVGSPIAVRGEARASWYSPQGTFPVRLKDEAGNILVDLYATALTPISSDGMTAFETFLDASAATVDRGMIVLEKADNTSGDPNSAGSIIIPVRLVR